MMRRNHIFFYLLFAVGLCSTPLAGYAQYDSSYIESYRGYLMPRLVFNRKTTGINYHNEEKGYSLRYQPNKTFNMGVGITYKFITLKASVGLLAPHPQRGDTRDFDVQFHSYGKKFMTDILVQFYKGFYLPDRRFGPTADEYYVRPDLAVSAVGGSVQYIFNHRKFSYRAAFQQTEWQKRSAGTFLVGMELFMGRFRGDSTIVPTALGDPGTDGLTKMRFIEFGPNAGYAYTWVYKKFFITTGAALSLNAGLNRFYDGTGGTTFAGVSPNTVLRVSSGYSVKRWGVNLLYLSTALRVPEFENKSVVVNTGTIRLNLIYRIYPRKKMRDLLKPIDDVEKRMSD
jgi:hypothetical protein